MRQLLPQALDYLELTKPRVTALVLVTVLAGFWLGLRLIEQWALLAPLLVGTALTAGGANALNQWSERLPDALMQRTKHRPLPAGRMPPERARRFGWCLAVGGIVLLAVGVNWPAALLAAISADSYVMLYTPLKRRTNLCTLVGAIPGALPPVIGWAGARGEVGSGAVALFAILFLWQLPHFLAIEVLYRDDYARAGFRMLPLDDEDGLRTARQLLLYATVLLPVSLFPTLLGLAGPRYFYGALVLGLLILAAAARAALLRSLPVMRQLFRVSVLYLPLLLSLLAADKVAG
jgi:protoheme IX farnesyltransferase